LKYLFFSLSSNDISSRKVAKPSQYMFLFGIYYENKISLLS